jgi:hypothetical protein
MQDDEKPPESEDEGHEQEEQEGNEAGQEPPDDDGTTVEPIEGDQGEYVEQVPQGANPGTDTGFNPNRPVRTSPPDPSQQEGVPRHMTGGGNEDVERDESQVGPQEPPVPGA